MAKDIQPTGNTTQFSAHAKLNYGEYAENSGLPIGGFAVHEGKYKDIIELPKSELSSVAKTLHDAQLRIDHSYSVRDIVGLVDEAQVAYNNDTHKDGVQYKAHIDDPDIAKGVQQNKIRDVSIGFDLTPECSKCGKDFRKCNHLFNEAHVIARDVKVYELSLVTRGADPDAHASAMNFMEQFSDKLIKEDIKGGNVMSQEDTQSVDIDGVLKRTVSAEKEAFESKKEAEKLTAEIEAMKAEKEQLEADKLALTEEKAKIEGEKAEIEEKFTKTSQVLSDKELGAKKREVAEVAKLKVEKGLIDEAELDEEIEKLMEVDSLSEIKALVGQFKKEKEGESKVPETQEFKKFTEGQELDYDDPKVEQAFVHEIFAYDLVFKGKSNDKVEGQSYMGFSKHS
ncbi:MAG: hypothetical protein Q8N08_02010 [Methanobacteriaceae archaeon]|nr:hypothetical protein [Methanobacteriaceae archaeon]